MPRYIIQQGRRYYAYKAVPTDLRASYKQRKLKRSLKTESLSVAITRLYGVLDEWEKDFQARRSGRTQIEPVEKAVGIFKEGQSADDGLAEIYEDEAINTLSEHFLELDDYTDIEPHVRSFHDLRHDEQVQDADYHSAFPKGQYAAFEQALEIANGSATPFLAYWDKWESIRRTQTATKTADMEVAAANDFALSVGSIQSMTKQSVQRWVNGRLSDGKAPTTVRKQLSGLRNYWKYLAAQGLEAPQEFFRDLDLSSNNVSGKARSYAMGSPELAAKVWSAAVAKGSDELADFILVGLYTGMRRDEIARLSLDTTTNRIICITDAKTKAGSREIPIHTRLQQTIDHRRSLSKNRPQLNGFLFTQGRTKSGAVGAIYTNRFTTARKNAGIETREISLHSLRKIFTTALSNAGANLEEIASIIGHKTNTITYDIYSAGPTIERKRELVERIIFELPLQTS